jgi:hypothetical protein
MKNLKDLWRRVKAQYFLISAHIFSFITRRKIKIKNAQISGEEGFWNLSFQVETDLPGKIIHSEILKFSHSDKKIFVVIKAIEIAEDICRTQRLKKTAAFLEVEGDKMVVFVEVNK